MLVVIAAAGLVAGCSTTDRPSQSPSAPTAATSSAAAPPSGAAVTAALATAPPTTAPPLDAVSFLRGQEAACRAHATAVGNPVVEPDRFAGARQVGDRGNGAYLVEDGRGTRLVVVPADGIVLPESGRRDDVMPPPYGFGCPENVFVGAADA